jgi:hypothetical protein
MALLRFPQAARQLECAGRSPLRANRAAFGSQRRSKAVEMLLVKKAVFMRISSLIMGLQFLKIKNSALFLN